MSIQSRAASFFSVLFIPRSIHRHHFLGMTILGMLSILTFKTSTEAQTEEIKIVTSCAYLEHYDIPVGNSYRSRGDNIRGLKVYDLNQDGNDDIVAFHESGPVEIFFSGPNGGVGAIREYLVGSNLGSRSINIDVGDFNHDALPDLLFAGATSYDEAGSARVLFNKGNGEFDVDSSVLPLAKGKRVVRLADLNGDSMEDVIVASIGNQFSSNEGSALSILINTSDGHFLPRVDYLVGAKPSNLTVTDVDNDHDQDLIVSKSSADHPHEGMIILKNQGDGTFIKFSGLTDVTITMTAADLRGSGFADIGRTIYNTYDSKFYFQQLENLGAGSYRVFKETYLYRLGWFRHQLENGDIDDDGDLDLILFAEPEYPVGTPTGKLFLNDGQGNMIDSSSGLTNLNLQLSPESGTRVFQDLDGDEDLDVVFFHREVEPHYGSQAIDVNFNRGKQGDGSWLGFDPTLISLADSGTDFYPNMDLIDVSGSINGDDLHDIVVARHGEGTVIADDYLTLLPLSCPSPTPKNFRKIKPRKETSLSLAWDSSDSTGEEVYALQMNDEPVIILDAETTKVTLKALSPGTRYSFTLASCLPDDASGTLYCSQPTKLAASTLASDPRSITLTNRGNKQPEITWAPFPSNASHYLLRVTSGKKAPVDCSNGKVVRGNKTALPEVKPKAPFSVRVCAVNADGDASGGKTATFSVTR